MRAERIEDRGELAASRACSYDRDEARKLAQRPYVAVRQRKVAARDRQAPGMPTRAYHEGTCLELRSVHKGDGLLAGKAGLAFVDGDTGVG